RPLPPPCRMTLVTSSLATRTASRTRSSLKPQRFAASATVRRIRGSEALSIPVAATSSRLPPRRQRSHGGGNQRVRQPSSRRRLAPRMSRGPATNDHLRHVVPVGYPFPPCPNRGGSAPDDPNGQRR